MPNFTTILIAATIAAVSATSAAARSGAYGDITAGYKPSTGKYCIKSGWSAANAYDSRLTKRGDCHSAAEWRRRGIAFDEVAVAKRLRNAPAERLAAR